ncbi:hypothetical protein BCT96_024670 [Vibrio splendidus]|uniref:hypothetical protein n=1 Tax=Vibrio splendidus TaxID=29497 RepID=UPI0039A639E9
MEEAKSVTDKPTMICCKTKSLVLVRQTSLVNVTRHGALLGDAEIAAAREFLGWPHAPFEIPTDVYQGWDAKEVGIANEKAWDEKFAAYKAAEPALAAEFERRVLNGDLPVDFEAKAQAFIQECQDKAEGIASRKASQNAIGFFGEMLPELLGGSADLAGSNLTLWSGSKGIQD